jgi:RNA polymerase sigma factor for flagellar operon FliA
MCVVRDNWALLCSLAAAVHRQMAAAVEMEDLMSWGALGLLEAQREFRVERGVAFATYAYYRMRGAMYRGARHATGRSRSKAVVDERALGEAVHGAVAVAAGGEGDEAHERAHLRWRLQGALTALPERERRMIQACYFSGDSIAEAGVHLGLSRSRSSRLHARALERLRDELGVDEPADRHRFRP